MRKLWPLILTAAFLLSACRPPTPGREAPNLIYASDVVNMRMDGPIQSIDPAYAQSEEELALCRLIFSGLIKLDETGNPAPDLAVGWEVSEDGLTYLFHLRRDVFFHD
ncbi:MAG: hypothetical protein FWE85_04195, partial [Clostridiales bacterium]|nr:hypothetical protein [Clostridiales bacterium]